MRRKRAETCPPELIPQVDERLIDADVVRGLIGMISETAFRRLQEDRNKRFPPPLQCLDGLPLWEVGIVRQWVVEERRRLKDLNPV